MKQGNCDIMDPKSVCITAQKAVIAKLGNGVLFLKVDVTFMLLVCHDDVSVFRSHWNAELMQ